MMKIADNDIAWYAMSATYRSELKVQEALLADGIGCYVAMQTVEKVLRGRKVKVRVPLVSNLIFVHSSRARIQQVKGQIPHLQFKIYRETGGFSQPIVVRDSDMENFIKATTECGNVKVSVLERLDMPIGTRVQVVGGAMDGLLGTLIKNAGKKSNNIVVTLDRLCSLQLVIPRDQVQLVTV